VPVLSSRKPTEECSREVSGEAERISPFSRDFILKKFYPLGDQGWIGNSRLRSFSGSNFLLEFYSPAGWRRNSTARMLWLLASYSGDVSVPGACTRTASVFSGTAYPNNLAAICNRTYGCTGDFARRLSGTGWNAVAARVWWHSPVSAMAFAGMTVAAPFILIHALGRRSFYLKLSPGPAAFGSAFYCAFVVGGSFLVYKLGWLSAFTAYLVMGLAALVGGVIMLFQLNAKLEPATAKVHLSATWGKHWNTASGRWQPASSAGFRRMCTFHWSASFSGLAVAGELRALMNLGGPVLQTTRHFHAVSAPGGAGAKHTGTTRSFPA